MIIHAELCVAGGDCIAYCPVGAIHEREVAVIDADACVECGVCARGICPLGAIEAEELAWPRVLRALFSDPATEHRLTGTAGRGTEEIKTEDVVHGIPSGSVALAAEVGRPGIGATFRDVERITRALADGGAQFVACNPLTDLMTDTETGALREEILDERVLSVIVESHAPLERVEALHAALREAAGGIDSVVSLNLAAPLGADGFAPYESLAGLAGTLSPNGKLNLGLGRAAETPP